MPDNNQGTFRITYGGGGTTSQALAKTSTAIGTAHNVGSSAHLHRTAPPLTHTPTRHLLDHTTRDSYGSLPHTSSTFTSATPAVPHSPRHDGAGPTAFRFPATSTSRTSAPKGRVPAFEASSSFGCPSGCARRNATPYAHSSAGFGRYTPYNQGYGVGYAIPVGCEASFGPPPVGLSRSSRSDGKDVERFVGGVAKALKVIGSALWIATVFLLTLPLKLVQALLAGVEAALLRLKALLID